MNGRARESRIQIDQTGIMIMQISSRWREILCISVFSQITPVKFNGFNLCCIPSRLRLRFFSASSPLSTHVPNFLSYFLYMLSFSFAPSTAALYALFARQYSVCKRRDKCSSKKESLRRNSQNS